MNTIIKLSVISILSSMSIMCHASTLSPQEALSRCYQINPTLSKFEPNDLVRTLQCNNNSKIYIYSNSQSGFAIVGNDDSSPLLLGYGPTQLNGDELPPDLMWWLEQYSDEINAMRCNNNIRFRESDKTNFENIAPLCKTLWGQVPPYNNDCPLIDGSRTYTGCVATSMAMIMKHHNSPSQGYGSHSYTWKDSVLSLDFSNIQFDWTLMRDTYLNGNYSEQEASEIAKLMYACGISVDMNYGLSGSGAEGEEQARALIDYFGYGNCTTLLERSNFYISDWEEILYNSLKAGAPIAYMGHSSGGGHAFIVDGYKDGFFHLNWGWTGDANGYFRINALNPYEDVAPGYYYGYNNEQKAVVFALPSNICNIPYVVMSNTQTPIADYNTSAETLTISGNFVYYGSAPADVTVGVALTNSDGETTYYNASTQRLEQDKALSSITANIPHPADGLYTVSPAYIKDNAWQIMYAPSGTPKSITMTVSNHDIIFSDINSSPISVTNITPLTPFYEGRPFKISYDLVNSNEYEQGIKYWVCIINDTNKIIWNWNPDVRFLKGNSNERFTFEDTLPYFSSSGEYQIGLLRKDEDDYTSMGELATIVTKYPPAGHEFQCSNFAIEQADNVADSLIFNYTLSCIEGYYAYKLRASIHDDTDTKVQTFNYTNRDFVTMNEPQNFTKKLDVSALDGGKTYTLKTYSVVGDADDQYLPLLGSATFTKSISGVNHITDDDIEIRVEMNNIIAPSNAKIYDIKGCKVVPRNLSKGIYFVCTDKETVKVIIR